MRQFTKQELLKAARKAYGATQGEFAKALGVSKPSISSAEIGRLALCDAIRAKMSLLSGIDVLGWTGKRVTKDEVVNAYVKLCMERIRI